MLSEYNDIEEDEEVIFEVSNKKRNDFLYLHLNIIIILFHYFQGNDLYEHLSALGYVDFETATVSKPLLTSQKKSIYMVFHFNIMYFNLFLYFQYKLSIYIFFQNTDIINDIGRNIYRYILDLKSWITQVCLFIDI